MAEIKRRDFLKLVSLGSAATVLANCAQPVEKIVPYLNKEEDITPGVSTYFATVCRECPAGCGMIIRTREGRALKAEGNPENPINAGKLCMRGQSSMQGLYNPDRFQQAFRVAGGKFAPVGWDEALNEFAAKINAAKGTANAIAYIGQFQSGTYDTLIGDFLTSANSTSRHVYEPISYAPLRNAARQTFGLDAVPAHDLSKAKVIVSFGADFLETWLSPVEYARQFAAMHSYKDGKMGSMTYVGPRLSLTAANADQWLGIKPGQELAVALAMLNVIISKGLSKADVNGVRALVADYTPERVSTVAGIDADEIVTLAQSFATAGPSLALAGVTVGNADALAVAVNLLNYAVGNVGQTVTFGPNQRQGGATADLTPLITSMLNGEVQVLVIEDVNPAFSLPNSAKWAEAIAKVPFVVVLSPYPSETASQAHLVLGTHTPYEQWNDYVPREGVFGLMQPVMNPVYDTRHSGDVLLTVARTVKPGTGGAGNYEDYLRSSWKNIHTREGAGRSFDEFFNAALQKGGIWSSVPTVAVKLSADAGKIDVKVPAIEGIALIAYPTIQYYDGRLANRPWLQEMPDVMTKIVWNSWIEVNPKTAQKLGVVNGDVLKVQTTMGTLEAPAYLYRGVREDVFAVPVGQGHTEAFGRYASELHSNKGALDRGTGGRGVNPLAILPALSLLSGATVSKSGRSEPLAIMQGGNDSQHDRDLAQVIPMAQVAMLAQKAAVAHEENMDKARKNPDHPQREWEVGTVDNRVAGQLGEEPGQNFYIPHDHPDHRWGMAINLSSCTGCGACASACYAENNIPIVGPELMAKGREMAWLWIERYFSDEPGKETETVFLPMLCQHCDNAPCETVCPVYATYHNPEGLNAQVYNRCVGTRYCGNNCPYKVRRFNWFEYEWPSPMHMQLNPDVSVRSKGVMEKCTFCVQRIRSGKDEAWDLNQPVADGDIVPACAQTCPTDAIVFGDLKNPESRVSQLARDPRGYQVLAELNTASAITYLRKVVREQES